MERRRGRATILKPRKRPVIVGDWLALIALVLSHRECCIAGVGGYCFVARRVAVGAKRHAQNAMLVHDKF